MNEKYTHWVQGAAGGAVVALSVAFYMGWVVSAGSAKLQSEAAVVTALIPGCVKDVMADPEAVAELKVKRTVDYDDVVRDFRKRTGDTTNLGYQFNRDCGAAIQVRLAKLTAK
jgi:invasion protein IalB